MLANAIPTRHTRLSAYCHARLTKIVHLKGYTVGSLEAFLHRRPGFWKWLRRRRQGLPLELFVEVCRAQGVHPSHLLEEALTAVAANDNAAPDFLTGALAPPCLQLPAVVVAVKACAASPPCALGDVVADELVERLEGLRFCDPALARWRIEKAVLEGSLPSSHWPGALAVAASAYRMLGDDSSAAACIEQGYRLPAPRDQLALLHLRHAFVLRLTQPAAAEFFTRKAQGIYAALGRLDGLGETVVELGATFTVLGRLEESFLAYQDALDHHRAHLARQQLVAALQGMASCHLRRSSPQQARRYLQQAQVEADSLAPYFGAQIGWSLATLDRDPGGFMSAAKLLLPGHPQDSALCGYDGILVASQRGMWGEARSMALALSVELAVLPRVADVFCRLAEASALQRPLQELGPKMLKPSAAATSHTPLRPSLRRG